jgi:predicted DNA-binding protein YlxM (UPF0122 family)
MKLYKSRDWLYLRYTVQRKSLDEMAKEAGCSGQTIYNHLVKFGLILNPRKLK